MSSDHCAEQLPIAIISVTYSPGEYLVDFLDSLDAATTRDVVVYLADNGSTDGVPQEQAKRENVEFCPTGGNVGYGAAINFAVEKFEQLRAQNRVDGRYFLFANPDVVFDPGSIDGLVECWERRKAMGERVGAVGPLIRQEDGSAYPSARAIPTLSNGIGHALFSVVWPNNPWTQAYKDNAEMDKERHAGWLSGSCLLVDWEAFSTIGGFDERYFMYMEDVDLGERLQRAGFSNVFCPAAHITHAVGHAAGKNPGAMLPAHHASAYRFQADRHPHWWQFPIRAALKIGLKVREIIVVRAANNKPKSQ